MPITVQTVRTVPVSVPALMRAHPRILVTHFVRATVFPVQPPARIAVPTRFLLRQRHEQFTRLSGHQSFFRLIGNARLPQRGHRWPQLTSAASHFQHQCLLLFAALAFSRDRSFLKTISPPRQIIRIVFPNVVHVRFILPKVIPINIFTPFFIQIYRTQRRSFHTLVTSKQCKLRFKCFLVHRVFSILNSLFRAQRAKIYQTRTPLSALLRAQHLLRARMIRARAQRPTD